MYIEPNTSIKILTNVPLDNTYGHTIYFADRNAQTNYFTSKAKYHIDRSTYQRVNKGSLKVGLPADNLYDCNYLMFLNAGFGSKWFYAFITSVEYINDDTTLITYQIDDMQTWFFDFELEQCFVEREHSVTDRIGENTVPENLELGGYITTAENSIPNDGYGVLFMATEDIPPSSDSQGTQLNTPNVVSGIPLTCYWKFYPVRSTDEARQVVGRILYLCSEFSRAGKAEAIISIITTPLPFGYELTSEPYTFSSGGAPRTLSAPVKNNKLYTYPYCCLGVNANAQSMELKYELFDGDPLLYHIISIASASPAETVIPMNYEGLSYDYTKSLTLKGYPLLGWITNYYQNWLAQNRSVINASYIKAGLTNKIGTLSLAGGLATGNIGLIAGGIATKTSAIKQVIDTVAEVEKHSVMPDSFGGTIDAVDNLFADGKFAIRTYCRTIRPEYLKIIDDYFTRFGYKTNRNKIPNINSRPHWNYVKTIACTIKGSLPADSMRHICSLFDNGITFWKNGNEIGNYTLDNRPS